MKVKVVNCCPKCGSYRTGRFVLKEGREEDYIRIRFAKGDRISFYSTSKNFIGSENCFCAECDATWAQKLISVRMTDEEFNEYLHKHEFYKEREELLAASKEKKHVKTVEEKKKSWSVGLSIVSWLTGLSLSKLNPFKNE